MPMEMERNHAQDAEKVQASVEITDGMEKVKINLKGQMARETSSKRPLRWWRDQAAEVPSSIRPLNDQTEGRTPHVTRHPHVTIIPHDIMPQYP